MASGGDTTGGDTTGGETWTFHNPVRVTFGAGSLAKLAAVLGERTAVLVTLPEAAGFGWVDRIRAIVGTRLLGVIDSIAPNPDLADLAPLHERFWRDHASADAIVAVGGGSVLDSAKVLCVEAPDADFSRIVQALAAGKPFVPPRVKALVTVPTTAGTGSEVTPWATVWDRAGDRKYSLHLRETWPEAAIVDPEFSGSAPPAVTLQSGLDALSHSLEAIWNRNANPVSDALAVTAARRMLDTLPDLMAHPGNRALRESAALAALEAGLAFSNTRTALAHSISYPLTLHHGLPHGIACSFTLPQVLERAAGRSTGRDEVLARVFDVPLAKAPDALREWFGSLGVSTRFEDYGVTEAESKELIESALAGPRGRNFIAAAPG